jgi:hypothetical protein
MRQPTFPSTWVEREYRGVVEVVEREHEGVVLASHWTGDGAEMHRRARREWVEFAKSRCSEGHTMFASRESNCST